MKVLPTIRAVLEGTRILSLILGSLIIVILKVKRIYIIFIEICNRLFLECFLNILLCDTGQLSGGGGGLVGR